MTIGQLRDVLLKYDQDILVYYFNGSEHWDLLTEEDLRIILRKDYHYFLWEGKSWKDRKTGPDVPRILAI